MSSHLEIEIKSWLNQADYEYLLEHFSDEAHKPYEQINEYVDTPNRELKKMKIGLRVRTKKGAMETTLKIKTKEGHLEINKPLDKKGDVAFCIEGDIYKFLVASGFEHFSQLQFMAISKTKRLDIKYKSALISIDSNDFNHSHDWEIEAEDASRKMAKFHLKEFLKNEKILFKENHISKMSRAFAENQSLS